MENNYNDYREQKLAEEIANIAKNLEDTENSDIRTLQEYIFVNVFLPFFAGDDKLLYNVTLDTWLNYAGGPSRSVNIIDKQNHVLFTVPPIIDRDAINPLLAKGAPLSHVITTANQFAQFHPSQGFNYLTAQLDQKAINTKQITDYKKDLEVWNTIFTRYGRKPIALTLNNQEQTPLTVESKLNCDFDLM